MASCILAINMGLHAKILGHFITRLQDLHPFEPLIPYVPSKAKPHKKDGSIISPKSIILAHKIHKSNIRMFIIWVIKLFLQILRIFLIFMKMVLMKKPTIVECFTCGDYDHMCIRDNIPYIFIFVEYVLGNWTSCMCYECLLSHLYNSTLESCYFCRFFQLAKYWIS